MASQLTTGGARMVEQSVTQAAAKGTWGGFRPGSGRKRKSDVERQQTMRSRFQACVTQEDWDQCIRALLERAKAGNLAAFRALGPWLVGTMRPLGQTCSSEEDGLTDWQRGYRFGRIEALEWLTATKEWRSIARAGELVGSIYAEHERLGEVARVPTLSEEWLQAHEKRDGKLPQVTGSGQSVLEIGKQQ